MKLYKFLSIPLVALSASSFAGGGAPSWSPSVDPINCIVSKSSNNGGWSWNDSPQCNEVIEHGYAKGVKYTGTFSYHDGTTKDFASIISPRSLVQYDHNGRIVKGITGISASWQQ